MNADQHNIVESGATDADRVASAEGNLETARARAEEAQAGVDSATAALDAATEGTGEEGTAEAAGATETPAEGSEGE